MNMKELLLSKNSKEKFSYISQKQIFLRLALLNMGFVFMALGIVMIVNSGLGANSWNVLHVGLSIATPLTLGQAIQVTSLSLIAINWILGEKPGLATFLELIVVG